MQQVYLYLVRFYIQ